jgi:hypothetical protein
MVPTPRRLSWLAMRLKGIDQQLSILHASNTRVTTRYGQVMLTFRSSSPLPVVTIAMLFQQQPYLSARVPYSFFPARGSPIVSRDQIISTGCREAQNKHIQARVLLRRHSHAVSLNISPRNHVASSNKRRDECGSSSRDPYACAIQSKTVSTSTTTVCYNACCSCSCIHVRI